MGEMRELNGNGDSKIIWNPDNAEEVKAAKEHFGSLIKKGFKAFRGKDDGEKGASVTDFDPSIRRLIMVPPIVGG